MTEELRMYTTASGEIPKLVRDHVAKCFVEYEQYVVLEHKHKELLEDYEQLYSQFLELDFSSLSESAGV